MCQDCPYSSAWEYPAKIWHPIYWCNSYFIRQDCLDEQKRKNSVLSILKAVNLHTLHVESLYHFGRCSVLILYQTISPFGDDFIVYVYHSFSDHIFYEICGRNYFRYDLKTVTIETDQSNLLKQVCLLNWHKELCYYIYILSDWFSDILKSAITILVIKYHLQC